MLAKDPINRPTAGQLLESLEDTEFRALVADLPELPEQVETPENTKSEKERYLHPGDKSRFFNMDKDGEFRFPFHEPLDLGKSSPFEPRVDPGRTHPLFPQHESISGAFEYQPFEIKKKPKLLFDASKPQIFPILGESRAEPKKSAKRRRRVPNLQKMGSILSLVQGNPLREASPPTSHKISPSDKEGPKRPETSGSQGEPS